MQKTVLWIDDSPRELQKGLAILSSIPGINPRTARSSEEVHDRLLLMQQKIVRGLICGECELAHVSDVLQFNGPSVLAECGVGHVSRPVSRRQ